MKIQHDLHVHTNLSVCAPRDAYAVTLIEKAKSLGLKKVGIANHFWDSAIDGANDFYKPQDFEHIELIKPELEKIDTGDIRIYFGCEGEYDPAHHGVAMTEQTAEKFEFIIVPNSHTHMMMPKSCYEPYEKHKEFMLTAYEEILNCNISRYITSMAHPFAAVACPYGWEILMQMTTDDEYKRMFDMTAEKNIAVEINMWYTKDLTRAQIEEGQPMRMYRLAKECGCKFTFGSDAHSADGMNNYNTADVVADILGLKQEDLAEIAR